MLGGDLNVVFGSRWLFCCKGDIVYADRFLGAFATLRQATIIFVMSVCPFVRLEELGFHWRNFDENWYLSIFRQPFEKIQSDMKTYVRLWQYLAHFILEWIQSDMKICVCLTVSRSFHLRMNSIWHEDLCTFMAVSRSFLLRMNSIWHEDLCTFMIVSRSFLLRMNSIWHEDLCTFMTVSRSFLLRMNSFWHEDLCTFMAVSRSFLLRMNSFWHEFNLTWRPTYVYDSISLISS